MKRVVTIRLPLVQKLPCTADPARVSVQPWPPVVMMSDSLPTKQVLTLGVGALTLGSDRVDLPVVQFPRHRCSGQYGCRH